jgi:hypothetical protein
MEFHSLKHYLNRLHILCYASMLVCFGSYIYQYFQPYSEPVIAADPWIIGIFLGIMITDWVACSFVVSIMLKKARKQITLYDRLKCYFSIAVIRMAVFTSGSLTGAVALYLTHDIIFSVAFMVNIVILFFYWPTASRLIAELKLTPAEREVLMDKKNT